MTKVKICGMMSLEHISWVNEFKPDYVGFIFANTRRKVSDELAADMKKNLVPDIKAVGVFVNEAVNRVAELANRGIIDVVQLHGDEDNSYIAELRTLTDAPVIKAIRVREGYTDDYDADYLLYDTYKKDEYGGTGVSFERSILRKTSNEKPVFIAGGVNAQNVSAIIDELHPYCVDVSSGVETDGLKDKDKIREFIMKVRKEL